MDVDILKTSQSDDSMMTMMMQMEKFPELCDPFYNNSLNYAENEFSCGSSTTTFPVFSNVNQNVTPPTFVNNLLQQPNKASFSYPASEKKGCIAAMREMIFQVAVMQPIHIDPESIKPPKRRNVKISKDPQSVAARHRRERISERIRILQRLVPGGTKMDTASMLDEAIHYVKFLKKQVQTLEQAGATRVPFNIVGAMTSVNYSSLVRGCQ